jgi:hypothetical protein
MIKSFKLKVFGLVLVTAVGCTKLDEHLNSTLTNTQTANALGSSGVGLLLQAAYTDIGGPFTAQDLIFSLQENSTDESLVPTRGGDWDDNGVWRVVHSHGWDANHSQVLNVYNSLNKINFDATNVLAFSPNAQQAAEARFIRALSLYQLLDLYGQFPVRNPGDNLLNAPQVYAGAAGADFIIAELTAIIPSLPATSAPDKANQTSGNVLLMKCYLNKGAWANRAAPTFADADMQKVISLGNAIITGGKYSLATEYFNNFDVDNGASPENIFTYVNTTGVNANNSGINGTWAKTLHYNSYTPSNPNAGWNGFSTISDFYNSFGATTAMVGVSQFKAGNTSGKYADTAVDSRIGGRFSWKSTPQSGIKPGFLIGQQYDEKGVAEKDRKNAPLAFDPTIANDMKETGANLEVTGIRIIKYTPDFSNGASSYGGPSGNDLVIFRYADVLLMVAEAKMRAASPDVAGALTLINTLRTARKAATVTSMPLANTANPVDPTTLLAERGREFYWEAQRRTDLIRFGVFLKPWQYKPTDDPKYLVFPIPSQSLAANPNLKQNPGY